MLFGAHESVAGGLHLSFERIEKVGGESLQIFTRNQRQWNPKPLEKDEIVRFKTAWENHGNIPVFSHASYLVNLATAKEDLLEKSINTMVHELERCAALGIDSTVLHPGSHGGDGVEVGLERFVKAVDTVFKRNKSEVRILLETTAGQGTGLGADFKELAYILETSSFADRLGICVDTCHIFAAGYDLRYEQNYNETMKILDSVIGLDNVALFHINDSKKECGSRVDRHEHIGKGEIGQEGFRCLVNDLRLKGLPMILETPKGDDLQDDIENLNYLRSIQKKD
ncbi:MAG: deoxyribonuclease IV [Desulfotalea sp.]